MSDSLVVNEIFHSIEGEGKRAGELATFIRLTGCNLRCSYCDTEYAFTEGNRLSIADIARRVRFKNVTITGGEPLVQRVPPLIEALYSHEVNIETNGSMAIAPYLGYDNVFITMDHKCGISGESANMLADNYAQLRERDVLKFVVGSVDDLREAKRVSDGVRAQIFVGPVFGRIEPRKIVEYMVDNQLDRWRLQLQLHKIVWKPSQRGV